MCGIAGFIGFKNNIILAENANRIQNHNGLDILLDKKNWKETPIWFFATS